MENTTLVLLWLINLRHFNLLLDKKFISIKSAENVALIDENYTNSYSSLLQLFWCIFGGYICWN